MFISTIICSASYFRHCNISTLFPRAKPRSHFCGNPKRHEIDFIQITAGKWKRTVDPFAEVTAEAREKAQEEPRFFGARMVEEVGRGSQGSLKRERELYGEDDHDFLRPKKIIQNGATVLPN